MPLNHHPYRMKKFVVAKCFQKIFKSQRSVTHEVNIDFFHAMPSLSVS